MVRRRRVIENGVLVAIAGALLLVGGMVGCGGGGEGNADGATTAPEAERPEPGSTRERAGLGVEAVSPGNYLPAGFGEGSLWATDLLTCNDSVSVSGSASASASGGASFPSSAQAMCLLPNKTLLRRLDPRTGEEVATVPLEDFPTNIAEAVVGAGSVWVSSASGEADAVLKVDPETERVVDRIPVPADSPTGLAFGHGSVWVTSAGRGTVSRVDPQTGGVAAKIEVGRGAVDVALDEGSGDVWVASQGGPEHNKLSRVDPATNRVVAEIPIAAHARYGGAQGVAAGEGAAWAQSGAGGELFKADPATNEVVARPSLGEYSSHLAVYEGAVWATAQTSAGTTRLFRIDPRTARVVASEELGSTSRVGYGRLVAGGGYVWFGSRDGLARVAP